MGACGSKKEVVSAEPVKTAEKTGNSQPAPA